MQIENIASPPKQTPQMRYACLHRAIERGLASDDTWVELTRVCVQLGLKDEAMRAFEQVEGTSARYTLENFLARQGLVERPKDRESRLQQELIQADGGLLQRPQSEPWRRSTRQRFLRPSAGSRPRMT